MLNPDGLTTEDAPLLPAMLNEWSLLAWWYMYRDVAGAERFESECEWKEPTGCWKEAEWSFSKPGWGVETAE